MPKANKEKIIFKRKNFCLLLKSCWLFLIFAAGGFLLFALFFLFSDFLERPENPSIYHLVASISAQKGPIKIDPEFSYQEKKISYQTPQKIIIPSVNIDIPVKEAEIVNGYWETATDSASFGLGSAYPAQNGNTVIFAHAIDNLFGRLKNLKIGEMVYILTLNQWFSFRVEEIKTVLPNEITVVSPTQDKRLTLYTCTGFNDSHRLVVIAKPEKKPLDKEEISR